MAGVRLRPVQETDLGALAAARSRDVSDLNWFGFVPANTLHRRFAADGMISDDSGVLHAVREEQVGRRPARTVYEVTDEGRLELVIQRDAALGVIFGSADPVSVVLLFAAGADASELGERLAARRRRIAGQLEAMTAERGRLTGQGVLPPLAVAAFRRGELRLEAELRWHEEFERQLGAGLMDRIAPVRAVGGAPIRRVRGPRDGSAHAGDGR